MALCDIMSLKGLCICICYNFVFNDLNVFSGNSGIGLEGPMWHVVMYLLAHIHCFSNCFCYFIFSILKSCFHVEMAFDCVFFFLSFFL